MRNISRSFSVQRLTIASAVVVIVLSSFCWAEPGRLVTLKTLLSEIIDRDASPRFPDPAYACRQFSSYDRASVGQNQPGWFANDDRSHFLGWENNGRHTEYVMMDAKGPGCVVRIWVTGTGVSLRSMLRIYIDDAAAPVLTMSVVELVGGSHRWIGPPLAAHTSGGLNLYLPIPYAKRCKITFDGLNYQDTKDKQHRFYYQINYRTYEPSTKVESFSKATLAAAGPMITRVQQSLLVPWEFIGETLGAREVAPVAIQRTLAAGDSAEHELASGGALRCLTVRLNAQAMDRALRSTVLVIFFDDKQTVWCPVGDFFGSGVGVNVYQGWWRKVENNGVMTCYWVMPYQETCTIRLVNLGNQTVTAGLRVVTGKWDWDDRTMYFHANWRMEDGIATAEKRDWNYIEITGKGVYVGDTLAVLNHHREWWGEGDEKITIDGEIFPTHFGTGTEDYYGYAWSSPVCFESPFHAQPRAEGPKNMGHTTNTRTRCLDAIPFNQSLKLDMEVWHSQPTTTMTYAVATYWYGLSDAVGNHGPAPEQARRPPGNARE